MDSLGIFGKSFQENMCKLMLYDRSYCDQMQEVLDVKYLELKYLQVFTEKLFGYKKQFGIHPTNDTLNSVLNTELTEQNEVIQKQVMDYFVKLQAFPDIQDKDYIISKSVDFCRKQVLKKAMMKSVPLLNKCSFEEIEKLKSIQSRISLLKAQVKDLEEDEKYFVYDVIPKLMYDMNLSTLKLKDGSEVSVGKKFYANARADKRADAYQWLRNNGLGDIIKNNISVTFGQGEENKAMAYANLAKEHGYEPSQKEDAHHASVSAVMKEWKEKGNEIPSDLFSVLDVDQVKIKNKS